ncbi:PLD nuclease N-terminal domain-containing protein [Actinoplanes sp. NPDC020271]|uniref:PLD nuclease N-terminal domain-containing protein n=1 Tax=Actinoplanes sp. NPDC020271 TaxID=3363896 RepID=UPI0037B492A7
MAQKKSWHDLSRGQQGAILTVGAAELVITTIAVADLIRRPAVQVRGPKPAWLPVMLVQPFGPLAYLAWGRRRP